MCSTNIERFAPRIAPLRDASRSRFHWPASRLGPLGVGWQTLSDPPRIGRCLEPAHSDNWQMLVIRRILSIAPEARARRARLIDEVEEGWKRFFVPEFELFVARRVDEFLKLGIGHAK